MSGSATSTSYRTATTKPPAALAGPSPPQKDKVLKQFSEALVVVFFACACGVLIFGYSLKVTVLLVALFLLATVVAFMSALRFSYRVAEATAFAAEQTRYEITPLRVTVLKQAKVADDVTECLEQFMRRTEGSPPPMIKEELLLLLRRGLGAERTSEVEAVVLKYTHLHDEDF